MLDWTKLQSFESNNLNVDKMMISVSGGAENSVG